VRSEADTEDLTRIDVMRLPHEVERSSYTADTCLCYKHGQFLVGIFYYGDIRSYPYIAPPSFNAHESENKFRVIQNFDLTDMIDILRQISVNKPWRYIGSVTVQSFPVHMRN
jgi:hypothetical protein